jgi:hypothetical protein
MFDVLQHFHA